ncbi:hypothetical protein [Variovorax sp. JS1663]|uniref:hypothetical protein n=1 Tax=Variovorax sp. JS1663 TaxID=1851577 RepID=UPI000B34690A|nr:hypothetical protein [Variovorax sp. JS1663]OUM00090.1 hypothetical protein A8M77_23180 [Variovorax sp. JS1663]
MFKRFLLAVVCGAAVVGATGCGSTLALDRAVLAYDTTTTDSVSKQLLLNIARARRNQPMHFTSISSIAATYKFAVNAGVAAAATGDRGALLVPLIGSSAEENPTISISPMQGEEFTQRLLTPFQEQKLTLLLRQGYDVDSLLRLLGGELRLQADGPGKVAIHHNRPSDQAGYVVFRRVMSHLSSIQDRHSLHVEPLHFQRSWTVPADAVTPETFASIYKDFSLNYLADKRAYLVSKRVNGRVMITNYDPAALPNEERLQLHAEAEEAPPNDILVDIREGYTGGEFPMHGRLRLRSFHEILTFIGRGMEEEPEFDVPPDARTPSVMENPVSTLEISETRRSPSSADLSVEWLGYYYAVRNQDGYQWNQKAFSLLYQLFQMSVSTVAPVGPAITISK